MGGADIPTGLIIALMIFMILVAVLWFFLPFAVFGIKPRIDRLEREAKEAIALLSRIEKHISPPQDQEEPPKAATDVKALE